MSDLQDRGHFETAYAGKAPWDIGKPQGAIAESVDLVTSPVLDVGCGTGENALFLAAIGQTSDIASPQSLFFTKLIALRIIAFLGIGGP